jgi:hypothetical protein
MSEDTTPINSDVVKEILSDPKNKIYDMSLEALVLLINTERLKFLHTKTHTEFTELKKRQDSVRALHTLIKKINNATNPDGTIDISNNPELQKLIKDAKELGVETVDDKTSYTKEERDRLVDNIRVTSDDLNVLNDMQLQTINRLTNERYESYQMARSILKPLHDAKMRAIKGIA